MCINKSFVILLILSYFSVSVAFGTATFRSEPISGLSSSTIYQSPSDPRSRVTAQISLNFPAGGGMPRIHAYQINTPQRIIDIYTNDGRPYVHFFEAGSCWPNQKECKQSTIPEVDFLPFKSREFHGPILANIEQGDDSSRFVVRMQPNKSVLLAVDLHSFDVVDGIVNVDKAKSTSIQRHASWPPGLACRQGLICYERFHRAGIDEFTQGRIRWANGTILNVNDQHMSQTPLHEALYTLGVQRVWKVALEDALPQFRPEFRSSHSFRSVQPPISKTYKLLTPDYLEAFEMAVRSKQIRPSVPKFYGYDNLVVTEKIFSRKHIEPLVMLQVQTDSATIRSGPGITHEVLQTVPKASSFPVIDSQEKWHKIRLDDGNEGWISRDAVFVTGSENITKVVPQPVVESITKVDQASMTPPDATLQKRVALVIGNAHYEANPLRNPRNDAADLTESLKDLGFSVTMLLDADQRQMEDSIRQFGRALHQEGVGLFYYAGHGMQVEGINYLIPIGAKIEDEMDIKYAAVDVGRVLDVMEEAGSKLNIVILDACRNNPYARSWRSSEKGLAAVQAPTGMYIAYATAPGKVAADGYRRNGVFTHHLLQHMRTPDMLIEQVFKRVRAGVQKDTDGVQTPWESSSIIGDFAFNTTQLDVMNAESAPPSQQNTQAQFQAELLQRDFTPQRLFKVEWISPTPGVSFDKPNPMQVPYGREVAVVASKTGYHDKTITRKHIDRDMVIDIGPLAPIVHKVTFVSETPGVSYDKPNPVEVAHGTTLEVKAFKEGYHSKMMKHEAVVHDITLKFGPLDKQPEQIGTFIKFDNGTALDTRTNLMWMTKDFHNLEGRGLRGWDEAQSWVMKMNQEAYGGYRDWRLPSLEEYRAIYDPSLPATSSTNKSMGYPAAFEGGGGKFYLSSVEANSKYVWGISFRTGGSRPWSKMSGHRNTTIRLIRYGQDQSAKTR